MANHQEVNSGCDYVSGRSSPTGDYDVQDTFHSASGPVHRAVDQSIQPGDGGYGFTLEALGMLAISARVRAYIEGFYLFNPEEENGVETDIVSDNPYYRTMSITDQYMARLGVTYNVLPERGLSFDLGLQVEGVPAEDLLGGNKGFRRPGYAISIDPGVSLALGAWNLSFSVPIAVYRNRVPDLSGTWEGDGRSPGDASFADYVISASIARRL